MSTSSHSLSGYQQSARSLAAKASVPLAAAAAALLPASAHAQAVAFHPTTGNVVGTYGVLFIDATTFMLSSSAGDIRIESGYNGLYGDVYSRVYPTSPGGRVAVTVNAGSYIAKNLSGSVLINAASFDVPNANHGWFNAKNTGVASPQWDGRNGYVGLKFFSNTDHAFHYGWLEVNTNADASQITVVGFGYNLTPGASILTGAGTEYGSPVPEPATSAALLALGAAGLVAYRKRKNLQRAAA